MAKKLTEAEQYLLDLINKADADGYEIYADFEVKDQLTYHALKKDVIAMAVQAIKASVKIRIKPTGGAGSG